MMRLSLLTEQDQNAVATIIAFRQTAAGPAVLITRRAHPPGTGGWCLPGGHCRPGESMLACANRELREECGLIVRHLHFLGSTSGSLGRSQAENIYVATDLQQPLPSSRGASSTGGNQVGPLRLGERRRGSSDAAEIRWVPLAHLPQLLFGHNRHIYDAAVLLLGESRVLNIALAPFSKRLSLVEDIDMGVQSLTERLGYQTTPVDRGALIVFEGIDGAGKTSQVAKLERKLQKQDLDVVITKWNSSPLLHEAIQQAKDQRILTPMLYCLLHAADMLLRYDANVIPALRENKIVLCDRYIYTSLARDRIRGVDGLVLNKVYDGLRQPDILFHCHLPVSVAEQRLRKRGHSTYYGSGLDCRMHPDKHKNSRLYAEAIDKIYAEILPQQSGYRKLNVNRSIGDIADEVWDVIKDVLAQRWQRRRF
jgi:dTMP kinase